MGEGRSAPVLPPRFSVRDLRWERLRPLVDERLSLLRTLRLGSGSLLAAAVALMALDVAAAPLLAVFAQALVEALSRGTGGLVWPATGFAAAILARQLAAVAGSAVRLSLAKEVDGATRHRMRRVALRPAGIAHLEDPEFQDVASRAADQGIAWRDRSIGLAAVGQIEICGRMLATLAMTVALAAYFPLLATALLALSLVARSVTLRQWLFLENVKDAATPERRKVDFWADLATGPAAGLEIRLFGLAGWVGERRLAAHYAWLSDYWAIRRAVLRHQRLAAVIAVASAVLALGVPGVAALDGRIDIAALAFCLVAAWGIFAITTMGPESYDIEYGKTAHRALRTLEALTREPAGTRRPGPAVPEIRFEHVAFAYPGSTRPVLSDLCLTIHPGERLAVVGVNGAGKTTLIKLLAGLYTPTSGRITVDGDDLRDLDPAAWRARMTALFQDFIRYPLTLRENVTLAAPGDPGPDQEVRDLLRLAGLDPLPDGGLDAVLWNAATAGRGLSGGQWQKVAAARALHAVRHGRRLVVLDEPTAHLDVKAEARFFDDVIGAVDDASVVLISHRLATVRAADRIVLIDGGQVAEEGSHDELVRSGGEYARLFRLQAARFDDDVVAAEEVR